MDKPFAPACERNQQPILEILKLYNLAEGRLLEVGSGTGQHAVFMSQNFPRLHWVCSDLKANHPGIKAWLKEAKLPNIHGPETFEIGKDDFPGKKPFQYVFTANTLHIISWKQNKSFFKLLGKRLREGSLVFLYGPFNYQGNYTSESNQEFDKWLKEKYSKASGIRNFEDVLGAMTKFGFKLLNDHEMPANNRMLVFERLQFKN